MNKVEALKHLCFDEFPKGIAEVICDIASNGQVCYPNESILVVIYKKDEHLVNDDEIDMSKHYTVCYSIDDFTDCIVYGQEKAREHYRNYYVSTFKDVRPFNGDF